MIGSSKQTSVSTRAYLFLYSLLIITPRAQGTAKTASDNIGNLGLRNLNSLPIIVVVWQDIRDVIVDVLVVKFTVVAAGCARLEVGCVADIPSSIGDFVALAVCTECWLDAQRPALTIKLDKRHELT